MPYSFNTTHQLLLHSSVTNVTFAYWQIYANLEPTRRQNATLTPVIALKNPTLLTGKDATTAGLALADAEYFGAAGGANALGSRSLILQGDCFGIPHFNFLPAFHAISLHFAPPMLSLPSRVANLSIFVNSYRYKIATIFRIL
jgi:hypothetical protein